MNEINGPSWLVASDVCKIPGPGDTPWHGYVYAIEYGSGIKIGHTTNLRERIKSIKRGAANYSNLSTGRVMYTPQHTNHKENETALHRHFAFARHNKSELFAVSLEEFARIVPDVEIKDESAIKHAKSDAFQASLISFITGGAKHG